MTADPLTSAEFENLLISFDINDVNAVAVAVSGGPDSLALYALLNDWAKDHGVALHALHVDHGLREESADEAAQIKAVIPDLVILNWDVPKDVRVQEEARKARYTLMAEYCAAHHIQHLFLAHHRDDQAETVLFRLAKGSGLDGLGGMRKVQSYDETLTVLRPFLDIPKAHLVAHCEAAGIAYLRDPSNENDDFARVRLRQARAVLEEEGLSAKRLSVTAKRLSRAREALDQIALDVFEKAAQKKNTKHIVFKLSSLLDCPEEIVLRVVLLAMAQLGPDRDYAARLERVEDLVVDLCSSEAFRKRTLGGVVFERDDAKALLILTQE